MRYKCDNCGAVLREQQALPADPTTLPDRLEEGGPVSFHECPACHALVHPWFSPEDELVDLIDVEEWQEEMRAQSARFYLEPHEIDWRALDEQRRALRHLRDNLPHKQLEAIGLPRELVRGLDGLLEYVQRAAGQTLGRQLIYDWEEELEEPGDPDVT